MMGRLVDAKYVVTGATTVVLQVFRFVCLNAIAGTISGYTVREGTAGLSRAWFYICLH